MGILITLSTLALRPLQADTFTRPIIRVWATPRTDRHDHRQSHLAFADRNTVLPDLFCPRHEPWTCHFEQCSLVDKRSTRLTLV